MCGLCWHNQWQALISYSLLEPNQALAQLETRAQMCERKDKSRTKEFQNDRESTTNEVFEMNLTKAHLLTFTIKCDCYT